ncbi:hypothetical protein SUGI_1074470 [Cryptomeria japonica]|uniref:cullin-1-like n=1 Tax=Cryptomeria japonica TaxID=3369 RepID=UPI002414A1C1|nr:cullin-1-like [Cryptomeria japonica]GLJ50416.1 hypothetical protein SUGI_1074470 [Cryptomeria japonica]
MLDISMRAFPSIPEKDILAEYLRENLAQRLLNHETADDTRERIILGKLKQECGEQFTSKMENMLDDSKLVRDTQRKFNEYLIAHPCAHLGLGFTAMVLKAEHWPTDNSFAELTLPPEMATCVEVFKEFYRKPNRKLTWVYSMGTCDITGYFDSGMKEISSTPYQASALLLFNARETLSYSEIRSRLNLTDDETSLLLNTLACGEYKILNKYPDTKIVVQTDRFDFNAKFSCREQRFSILPTLEQAANKKERVVKNVNVYRREAIDALVVRIMKSSRRVLDHKQLVEQCIEQVGYRFHLDNTMIKKSIERLIEREYMVRSEDDPNTYIYLD